MSASERFRPADLSVLQKSFMGATQKSALLMFRGVVEKWISEDTTNGCRLRRVTLKVFQAAALPMQKGSELKKIIDRQMMQMKEAGRKILR